MKRPSYLAVFVLFLAAASLACGLGGGSSDQDATVEALGQSIMQTSTAGAVEATATPDTAATVAAIQAAATEQILAIEATEVVVATQVSVEQAATADVQAPIKAELPTYGVDPAEGKLGWIHPPLTIFVEGYLEHDYGGEYLATVAEDFVLAADITWNTRFGTTGCGFVIRSNGQEEAFDQYLVIATRGASGHVAFAIMQDGNVLTNQVTDIYANGIDPLFEWQNDTTNRMAVVGRGNTFSIYTNGTKIGEVTPSIAYDKGFIAFVALNESGDTTCHFNNAWLWQLN